MERTTKKAPKGEAKEHKKPWQETYATVEEIKDFLRGEVMLRYNVITRRVECHLMNRSPWDSFDGTPESGMQLLMALQEQQQSTDKDPPMLWRPITDRIVNSLWVEMSKKKPVRLQDLYHVIESDFVTEYHPFRFYLENLKPWDGGNHILAMSVSVRVKGGVDEQMRFYEYLRKWLVAMVAGWLDDEVVNHVILTFIGKQGIYKTTWFNYILPPELRNYFYTKTNAGKLTKDDLLTLAQYGLVCYEELDTMSPRELNQLKSAVTMPAIDERAAYAHFHEHRAHIASFCGTGNNTQFLSDDTGNRRWLPFEVESILSPRDFPFDYPNIYAEAYALYKRGFQYWFSQEEIRKLAIHNEAFESPKTAHEAILRYLRKTNEGEPGEFVTATDILQLVGSNPVLQLTTNKIGRAMTALGFERMRSNTGARGYIVRLYSAEEIKARQRLAAYDAKPESQSTSDTIDEFGTIP